MALQFEQIQRQTQQLIMTPQMKQAIQLLQLPLMELCNVIDQEMVTNPVLEESIPEEKEKDKASDNEESQENQKNQEDELDFKEEFDRLSKIDDEWRDYFRQSGAYRKYSQEDEERRQYLENSITHTETLQDHLLAQLNIMAGTDEEKEIGVLIIGNIDDNGYFKSPIDEVAMQLNKPVEDIDKVLRLIQNFHPLGVGARTLRECLLLQIQRLDKAGSLAEKIVELYLDELAKKRYAQIAKKLKTTPQQIQKEAEFIATLEPKPGRMFVTDTTQYVLPDVILEKVNGEYKIILNDDKIPHLRISNVYKALMSKDDVEEKTKDYIKEKIKSGKWLLKNIHQRQQTIYNIANEIVIRQRRLFDEGIVYLKPMTMQVIAGALGLHESTVSRAISGKYIQTPRGIFQMKYFFTTPIPTDSGRATSATTVKDRINEIIKAEDCHKPLSDSKIIDLLKEEGINLARRTVAKYRKEMNILPANLRKKY